MTNLVSVLKSRDITLPTQVHIVTTMVFPVVVYACASWTTKKAEGWRVDAFELWCWRRLLRVPWTARRSNQSILKEISPEYSLEGLMLKLKLHYFGHLIQRTNSLEKTLMLGRIECRRMGNRGWDGWMASPTQWTWVWANFGRQWKTGTPGVLQSTGSQSIRHDWATEQQAPGSESEGCECLPLLWHSQGYRDYTSTVVAWRLQSSNSGEFPSDLPSGL